jgi:hypothetical protein
MNAVPDTFVVADSLIRFESRLLLPQGAHEPEAS